MHWALRLLMEEEKRKRKSEKIERKKRTTQTGVKTAVAVAGTEAPVLTSVFAKGLLAFLSRSLFAHS